MCPRTGGAVDAARCGTSRAGRQAAATDSVAGSVQALTDRHFAPIETALDALGVCAARLPANDAAAHVRRSIAELRFAFTSRAALEPIVDRVLRSLLMLRASSRTGQRRDYRRELPAVDALAVAFEKRLLPELRRVGFHV